MEEEDREGEGEDAVLYHVTLLAYVAPILANGLRRGANRPNWTRGNGEPYGGEHVYVCSDLDDAIRWGARMEWHLFEGYGTRMISVLDVDDDRWWSTDVNDPLTQIGLKGRWLKRKRSVEPKYLGMAIDVLTSTIIKYSFRRDKK